MTLELSVQTTAPLSPWRALYWEPVAGTGERLMIGVVFGFAGEWRAVRTIRDDVLECLFGKAATTLRTLLTEGLQLIEAAATAGGSLQEISVPLFGLHPGPLRETEARSSAELLQTATLLYSSLGNLDKLDEAEESDAPLPEEVNRRFSTEVRDFVALERPDMVPGFGRSGQLIEGGQRVRFGYLSVRAVLHFTVLHPVRHSASVRDARARLFELHRVQKLAGIPRAALVAAVPRDDDPTLGSKQREQLRVNRYEIEREADSVGMLWHAVTEVPEAGRRVIEIAG